MAVAYGVMGHSANYIFGDGPFTLCHVLEFKFFISLDW